MRQHFVSGLIESIFFLISFLFIGLYASVRSCVCVRAMFYISISYGRQLFPFFFFFLILFLPLVLY